MEIPSFERRDAARSTPGAADPQITRVDGGSPGGKTVGLATIEQQILPAIDDDGLDDVVFEVPQAVAIGTAVYDAFIKHNKLQDLANETDAEPNAARADERVRQAFARAELPALCLGDLRALVATFREPLAVRSSSLLEDALAHPFAGVYGTKMIPNVSASADQRFRELIEAIKYVYATTLFRGARRYLATLGDGVGEEKMALVVQRVAGRRFGRRFYPCVSAVARSFNYYAFGHAEPEDGVVDLALGLGKTIVDGGRCWSYCPSYPQAPPPVTLDTLLDRGQREFWALDLEPPPQAAAMRESQYLLAGDLAQAEADGLLPRLCSSYDGRNDRLVPGLVGKGARLLDFAPLLKLELAPLNEAIRRVLAAAERALGQAVELELAASWDPGAPEPLTISLLQVRAMRVDETALVVDEAELADPGVVVASEAALGNGARDDLEHVVYLEPEAFDAAKTRQIAAEVAAHNRALEAAQTPYALIGFGRWGSSDPWLGVPVEWSDIAGAKLIVEATLPKMNIELSQGSHFFHNMISFGVTYLSVRHGLDRPIDWEWLSSLETVAESPHVRVVRCPTPLRARVDGRHGRGLLRRGG